MVIVRTASKALSAIFFLEKIRTSYPKKHQANELTLLAEARAALQITVSVVIKKTADKFGLVFLES